MKLNWFANGTTTEYNVPDNQGTLFISNCRNLLVKEGRTEEEVAAMTDDTVIRRAVTGAEYNSWHKQDRHADKSLPSVLPEDKQAIYGSTASAEDEFFLQDQKNNIYELLVSYLSVQAANVFYYHAIRDMTFAEVGKCLGIKPDTAAHQFYAAQKFLQKKYEEFSSDPSKFLSSRGYPMSGKKGQTKEN